MTPPLLGIDHITNFMEVEYPETVFDQHLEKPTMAELKQAYVELTTKGDMSNDNLFKAICFITNPNCTK